MFPPPERQAANRWGAFNEAALLKQMKTNTQIKFDKIIKVGFHEVLKPIGFKKKANNFYLQLEEVGQIINIQKSTFGTKEEIRFTINTGIFVPEYWRGLAYNHNKEIPSFPTEIDCLIRKRIGRIRYQCDTWYDINENVDANELIQEMKTNIIDFILPYFKTIDTHKKLLKILETESLFMTPIGKLIVYAELNQTEKAKKRIY